MRTSLSRLAALFVPAMFLLAMPLSADEPAPMASLTVKLSSLRSAKGKIGCTLYDAARGFPPTPTAARQRLWCAIDGVGSTCVFEPIPRGTYAVACFHDENDNGKCDTNWLGIPTEGTVVSNHAKGTLGAPSFGAAKFTFAGTPSELALTMSY